MQHHKRPPASILFIFGGSGDLNYRKLTPALYNLFLDEWMPDRFAIVGIGRTEYTPADYRKHLQEGIEKFSRRKAEQNGHYQSFFEHVNYLRLDAGDVAAYQLITDYVQQKEAEWGVHPNVIFYLAVAPQLVPSIAQELGTLNLCKDTHATRIVIEKPFGHDLESAHELNALLTGLFAEEQIFRIDHYLPAPRNPERSSESLAERGSPMFQGWA